MRILLINQFFWPDSSATSQLLTDLARGLAADGHDVVAICTAGGYAVEDDADMPLVSIRRVRSIPFARGKIGRILSYLSFYLGATILSVAAPKPDIVITLTTPPLLSVIGTLIKKLRGGRHFIWEMDIYPDVAVDLKYIAADGFIARIAGAVAAYSRQEADGVIALGDCMKERLVRGGVAANKISVAENWADGLKINPIRRSADGNNLFLLYSGNLGLAHDLQTLQGAMLALKDDERFVYRFVGSGGRRDELKTFCEKNGIGALELLPYVQRAGLSESLAAGDVGLVTQNAQCCGSVVPSKVYGLLAAGRPVLFIGPREATPARLIARFDCGWHIECGDVDGLSRLLVWLADHRAEIDMAGQRARRAFLAHYDLPHGVARVSRIVGASSEKARSDQARHAA